jgi:hypothetical protein
MSDFQQYLERLSEQHEEAEAKFNEEVQDKLAKEREEDKTQEAEQLGSLPFEEELIKHGGGGLLKGGLKKLGLNTSKDFEGDILKNPVRAIVKEARKQAQGRLNRLTDGKKQPLRNLDPDDPARLKAPSVKQADVELADNDLSKFIDKELRKAKKQRRRDRRAKKKSTPDDGEEGSGSTAKAEAPAEPSLDVDGIEEAEDRLFDEVPYKKAPRSVIGKASKFLNERFGSQPSRLAGVDRLREVELARDDSSPLSLQKPKSLSLQEQKLEPTPESEVKTATKLSVDSADSNVKAVQKAKNLSTQGEGNASNLEDTGKSLLKSGGALDEDGNLIIPTLEEGFGDAALAEGGLNPVADILALGAGLAGLFGSIFGGKKAPPPALAHSAISNPTEGFGITEGN